MPAQEPPPPALAAAPPSQPSVEDDWSDLDVSDAPAEPSPGVDSAVAVAPPAPMPWAPVSIPSPLIAAAEVVALDDLDFGEPSPFAAPPRPAVEPAPEQPEAIDLPMLEAEEEIELAPASELVTRAAETGHPRPAAAVPRPELGDSSSATSAAPSVAIAADGGEAQLRAALSHASREVIERIAWEVVPQLAEIIIREQLDRLVKERQR